MRPHAERPGSGSGWRGRLALAAASVALVIAPHAGPAMTLAEVRAGGIYCHDGFNDNNRARVHAVIGGRVEIEFLQGPKAGEIHRVAASEMLPMSECAAEALKEGLDTMAAVFSILEAIDKGLSATPGRSRPDHAQAEVEEQFRRGVAHASGQGGIRNDAEAARWFRRAAEGGLPQAQYNLGTMHAHGRGVPQNHADAAYWYRRAAEQGLAAAQLKLGFAHAHGLGVEHSHAQAVAWFRQAALRGDASASFNLGAAYSRGQGVARDDVQALSWFAGAARQGHARARVMMGLMHELGHGTPRNDAEAARWYRMAAEQGEPEGQYGLGVLYLKGRGVVRDRAAGVNWLRSAAARGHQDAARELQGLGER